MSSTLKMASYTRQEQILPSSVAAATSINIIGVGTVGSHAGVALAELGIPSFHLWDRDIVESHNLPSQHYTLDDLNRSKVVALSDHISSVNHNADVRANDRFFEDADPLPSGVVVLAVDNVDTRKSIFESSIKHFMDIPMMIDVRMSGNKIEMYAIDPSDHAQIETYMTFGHSYTQDEAEPAPCGGRTVSYVGPLSGALVANYVRLGLTGTAKVPLMTQVDLDLMMFNTMGGKEFGFGTD